MKIDRAKLARELFCTQCNHLITASDLLGVCERDDSAKLYLKYYDCSKCGCTNIHSISYYYRNTNRFMMVEADSNAEQHSLVLKPL